MATLTEVQKKITEAERNNKGPFKTAAEASLAKNEDLLLLLERFKDQIPEKGRHTDKKPC